MTAPRLPALLLLGSLLSILLGSSVRAADWPMARYDAARSAASPQVLADELHLQWVRDLPPLQPAWPDQPMMQFDAAYVPVVLGKTLYIASSRTDSVTALDTETGAEKWHFVTDGPVRFAPVGWNDKIYVVSDDGYLYCLDAARGSLLWKFRGGPSDRKILGNSRLISTWPARGAPVIGDGTVYFAASIWPFMGIFIHALDARTGAVIWTNDGDGSLYMQQPHHADSFAGVAPQGPLVVAGDYLLIPGGRSVPACYDRRTGKLVHYRLAENSSLGGGSEVIAGSHFFCNGGVAFDLATGEYLGAVGEHVVLSEDIIYSAAAGECRAHATKHADREPVATVDRRGNKVARTSWSPTKIGSFSATEVESLIKSGSRLYVGSKDQVMAVELPLIEGQPARVSWRVAVEGNPVQLAAADDRLFVVTREGRLACFGANKVTPRMHKPLSSHVEERARQEALPRLRFEPATPPWSGRAQSILETTQVRDGYCIAWGIGTGRLITALARQSNLRIIAVDPDTAKVNALRQQLIAADLYGERVTVLAADPLTISLPPYLASLMIAEDPPSAGIRLDETFLRKAYQSLRPYGGIAWLPIAPSNRAMFHQKVSAADLYHAKVREAASGVLLSREGALFGAADWTHEHADAANTRVSKDQLVKAPLGVLWFGGSSHDGILPRHGHGPQPQVIDGRLFIEGVDMLRAMDIYTGRVLWEANLPGVGKLYDNLSHQPGANATGTNFVSTSDGIYILHGKGCVRLDPATGRQLGEYQLPSLPGQEPPRWRYLNVYQDYLIGGADPNDLDQASHNTWSEDSRSSSKALIVLDRHTGRLLWSVMAQCGFRNNAICVGNGRLYCIDRLSEEHLAKLKRRGTTSPQVSRLLALDLSTGRQLWQTEYDVFGTWLSYSNRHDVLIEAGRVARDTLYDEPRGMRAYRGGSGQVLWYEKSYVGPAMIRGDVILKDCSACDLLTGLPRMRPDPLTGQPVEWTWARGYGCNTPAASEHLLTFRSGAAGYYDLANDGGTGNFGGFRSSCTNNLIVAGGLLNAPDYTRTCKCSYQNQTSLALVHMPEAEMWTYYGTREIKGPVRHVGISLGAPGNRKADNGTVWLEYPPAGGPSPRMPITITPSQPEWFRRHSSRIIGGGSSWVAASGAKGLSSLTLTLAPEASQERSYTVRLYFVEPDHLTPGQRVFDVGLQGRRVQTNLDIVKEAGEPNRLLVKEFKNIPALKDLMVTLTPSASAKDSVPVLCGIEVLAEGW